jgi:hypothetical protein
MHAAGRVRVSCRGSPHAQLPITTKNPGDSLKRSQLTTLLAFSLALLPIAANAQLFRAYVASDGNDANPCTLAQPCRLLPAAVAAVANGGQIWMLDSANYNTTTVDLNKSVTILAVPGAVGSVVATAGPAINIATGGVMVALRNLVITPLPSAVGGGITMTAGQRLTVENCLISGLSGQGIRVEIDAQVSITDTTIRGNMQDGVFLTAGARAVITRATVSDNGNSGIAVVTSSVGTTVADVAYSTLSRNAKGVFAYANGVGVNARATVLGSQVVDNDQGIVSDSFSSGSAVVSASGNMVSNNTQQGLLATGGSGTRLWASGNTVVRNGTGMAKDSHGTFETASDNAVRNNTIDQSGVPTAVPKS